MTTEPQPPNSEQPQGTPPYRMDVPGSPPPEATVQQSPPPEQEPEPEDPIYDKHSPKDPITGDEIKEVAADMWDHAKDVYLIPVRREVRSVFRFAKEFLTGLGSDGKKR